MPHRGAGVAPIFAALEGGYYREQGLEPELVPFHGHSNSLKGLIAGEADFTNAVGAELLLANARYKGDAVILASAISRSAQQVAARPGIETREDLRGKRWGVGARNDADECAIIMAFDRWGWSIDSDAEIVVVGTDGARLDLLLTRGVSTPPLCMRRRHFRRQSAVIMSLRILAGLTCRSRTVARPVRGAL
jgi:ABC-type nitrate/sulfonate/bicarbonate transport system substrate-binding protein